MLGIACQIDYKDESMQRFVRLINALEKLTSIAKEEKGHFWEGLLYMEMWRFWSIGRERSAFCLIV